MKRIRLLLLCAVFFAQCTDRNTSNRSAIKTEIERLLKIQEDAYGDPSEAARKRIKDTCLDSLVFVGGDNGGMATSADFYVHDLADGYTEKPHDRHFQIYDNLVIVTSIHQGYKLLSNDSLLLNSLSTKIFTRVDNSWKMAYVTYAPRAITYTPIQAVDERVLQQYAGEYKLDAVTNEKLSVREGKLISTVGSEELELRSHNDSTFTIPGFFGKTVFVKNKNGKVTHYYFEWPDGQRITFPKVN